MSCWQRSWTISLLGLRLKRRQGTHCLHQPQKPTLSLCRNIRWGVCWGQWPQGELLAPIECLSDSHKPPSHPALSQPWSSLSLKCQSLIDLTASPVALTHVFMKCLERLVLQHIKANLPPYFDPHQFAYRANRSTDASASGSHHHHMHCIDPRWTQG